MSLITATALQRTVLRDKLVKGAAAMQPVVQTDAAPSLDVALEVTDVLGEVSEALFPIMAPVPDPLQVTISNGQTVTVPVTDGEDPAAPRAITFTVVDSVITAVTLA